MISEVYAIILGAFTFGLISSFHCVGMCGPLALQAGQTKTNQLLYQLGRFVSYLVLGSIIYYFSGQFFKAISVNIQDYALYTLALVYLLAAMELLFKKRTGLISRGMSKAYHLVFSIKFRGVHLRQEPFLLGLISALLPCGLLHTFLLGVIPLDNFVVVFLYISSFWISTSSLLVIVGVFLNKLKQRYHFNSKSFTAGIYICLAVMLILVRYKEYIFQVKRTCH